MRTILLLGIATGTLLLAGHARGAETQTLDYGTPQASDTRVYTGHPDRVPSEIEYRRVDGHYDAEGRWTGTWDGTYEAPDGRRFDGRYEGSVEHRHGTGYAPPPAHDPHFDAYRGHDPRHDAEMERRCGRGGTAGGAVVGSIVGGVVGNRIAGKGNRTAGTLIGGGLGAVAGAAIGDAADRRKCEQWWASRGGGYYQGQTSAYHQGDYYGHHGYGYGYGYGYYTPGVVVITTITTGAPVITETIETSTRTFYENVPVRKRIVTKKKPAPKPKPRCVC